MSCWEAARRISCVGRSRAVSLLGDESVMLILLRISGHMFSKWLDLCYARSDLINIFVFEKIYYFEQLCFK